MKKIEIKFPSLQGPVPLLTLGILFLFTVCVYPFVVLLGKVFFSAEGGGFSFQYLAEILESASTYTAILNTLLIATGTTLLCSFIAIPLAWMLVRTNLPGASRLRSWCSLPYAIPPYIGAIAWIYLANPSNGILNLLLGKSIFNVYSFGGLIWVMSSFFFTFILLSLLSALDRMDSSLEEAARLSGARPTQVFFRITLPLILPALISGALLVFLASAASFGVPALIGSPARIFLMTTKIYTFQKMGSLRGIYLAAALSSLLLLFALVILVLNQRLIKKLSFQVVSGKASRPSLIDLGRWKNPLFLGILCFVGLVLVLPLGGILITALSSVQGRFSFDNFGLQNFRNVFFGISETPRALKNSLILGVGAATFATFLGMLLSYVQWKTKLKGRRLLDIFASLPYAAPGTVVALALIISFSGPFLGFGPSLYNTLWILWLAYVIKFLSFSIRTTGDGFGQIDDCLAEAARVSGASWWVTLKTIWYPLMKPSLVAAWFLIFMPAFSELTMTVLLTGPGMETVGTLLFQLQEYADVSGGGAAVLALVIICAVALINWLVKLLSKGKYGL